MALRLYNTLTRQVEELKPLNGTEVRMYTCGPTVYDFAHIGNFRTYVFADVLRRYILYQGLPLKHVMNVTDVDDKIIVNAQKSGQNTRDYTRKYAQAFFEDMEALRIQKPEVMPYATDHIPEMIEIILKLQEKGFTYQSEGSTYYRISNFSEYGKLSHMDLAEGRALGRIDSDEYTKENPRDFALWKAAKESEQYWDSPLGPGRPGWHIECSAMSMKYLGESFDIHCGGVDLIFPHHENEIAQSEAATGKPFVRHWVHGEFLIVEGEKMSKSSGNFYTIRDLLERGCNPPAVRYLLMSTHYRKQLNFRLEGVEQSQAALKRINDFLQRIREIPEARPENPQLTERIGLARSDFEAGMDDDLNTSVALAALFELIKDVNHALDVNSVGTANREQILQFFSAANQVFDVFQVEEQALEDEEVLSLLEERVKARRQRDFDKADQIRDRLAQRGIILEDTKDGTRWKRVS
ncbi:MAG: cysteine--tRNA ligase [Acidobacteriota bacterium]